MIARFAASGRNRWRFATLVTAFLAMLASPLAGRAAAPDPTKLLGHWMAESEKIAIEIYRCEEELCGRIAWIIAPYRSDGSFKRDKRNPDPALRQRGYCGIQVITGLKAASDNVWKKGKFYYVKKGTTYDLDIKLRGEDRLELRGYLGIPLLGLSETWTRPDPNMDLACVSPPEGG